jgi:hypothetical protein
MISYLAIIPDGKKTILKQQIRAWEMTEQQRTHNF